ncbi:hypothetical protein THAOC_17832 [Thalassiosira oceanica]|uniref:Uncharacterized protein n=1 Tax=Thalassiosira oceanica TaxID=159749 RepID=K0STR9_THAOC|nr:hypothetical protein THAOC_17832 [Thalassiosira oceanica]|eukprot:EJK61642.1 hypothetical protein THAOC_17832 [Thalassiosira oceanica]
MGELHVGQVSAAIECVTSQLCDARRYRHSLQSRAATECVVSNDLQRPLMGELHVGQVAAAHECPIAQLGDAWRYRHSLQSLAVTECVVSDDLQRPDFSRSNIMASGNEDLLRAGNRNEGEQRRRVSDHPPRRENRQGLRWCYPRIAKSNR